MTDLLSEYSHEAAYLQQKRNKDSKNGACVHSKDGQ